MLASRSRITGDSQVRRSQMRLNMVASSESHELATDHIKHKTTDVVKYLMRLTKRDHGQRIYNSQSITKSHLAHFKITEAK